MVAINDRSYDKSWDNATNVDQSWHPTIDRMINRGILRPIVDQSWHPTIDRTINRGILRPIVYQSWHPTIDRTTSRRASRMGSDLNPRNISELYSVSEQSIGGTTGRKVVRPVARLIVRPLTIWNRRLQVLNMTIELVATDLPLAITHDLCDQSYVHSTICLRL